MGGLKWCLFIQIAIDTRLPGRRIGGMARPKRRAAEDVLIVEEGSRVAVVADTHANPHSSAHAMIARESPVAILHAGDIGDLAVLDSLGSIAPVYAVRGNIDGAGMFDEVPDTRTIDLAVGTKNVFRIVMLHIAVYGPRLRPEARKLAKQASADLVVCGHSHVPFGARDGGVSVFNPGSIGPRRFQLPIVFGVLTFSMKGIRLKHVDCETGIDWTPPPLDRTLH